MTSENRHIHNALKQVKIDTPCSKLSGFSISGLATYLQMPELDFCVDMGECPLSATPINHVFLTHAHGDHARCLMRHHSLRKMMGVERDSVYYVPESIYEGAKAWIKAEAMFEGVSEAKFRYPQIVPVSAGKRIFLEYRKDLALETFEVKHSVPSMGGTLYFYKRKLKDEFLGKTPAELIELRKQKVEITREVYEPLVSFTGDCLGESLLEHKDVFKSKVLITECTFLDPGEEQMAHQKGHTHIADIVRALNELDSDVKCDMIILNHFSMKYAEKHIRERIAKEIPAQFSDKVVALI
ncbi:MBL fold metallo-hydrolase [uncultured Fibrobacter sp.]|uniref:MBL fold metallo-hydrolase n=1 Tax=uncultured Fibrobacter sp. TaxID=261512 RepID=UPI0025F46985|nr:MBL fold metallo-hydrolase [uncultured Fibrobacter sp.]